MVVVVNGTTQTLSTATTTTATYTRIQNVFSEWKPSTFLLWEALNLPNMMAGMQTQAQGKSVYGGGVGGGSVLRRLVQKKEQEQEQEQEQNMENINVEKDVHVGMGIDGHGKDHKVDTSEVEMEMEMEGVYGKA